MLYVKYVAIVLFFLFQFNFFAGCLVLHQQHFQRHLRTGCAAQCGASQVEIGQEAELRVSNT